MPFGPGGVVSPCMARSTSQSGERTLVTGPKVQHGLLWRCARARDSPLKIPRRASSAVSLQRDASECACSPVRPCDGEHAAAPSRSSFE